MSGRHLSLPRLALLVAAVTVAVFVALSGWRVFQDTQAAADDAQSFAGYVDATVTPLQPFEEPPSKAAGDVVLSFIVATPGAACQPSWGGAYSLDDAATDLDLDRRIARLRQNDGSVMISFGGAVNQELATVCDDPVQLLAAYRAVVERYDLRTVDLDIEGGALADTAANARRATAIKQLQEDRVADGHGLKVWLTLPVAPSGLTAQGRAAVSSLLDGGVDLAGVNVMTMDYGTSRAKGQSMIDATTDALRATHGQLDVLYSRSGHALGPATLWKRMGATPMIGQNDVAGEIFTVDDAHALSAFAADKGLARLSMWSLNRDRTCGTNYPDVTTVSSSCSGVVQGSQSFATILAGGVRATTTTPTPVPAPAASAGTTDDAATSPYPIWLPDEVYVEGVRIVWHRNAYTAKWWTLGDVPDDPVVDEASSPWRLIGPVLPGETPVVVPTVPAGTYPGWDKDTVYRRGERVLLGGVAFSAQWYNQDVSPDARSTLTDPSPWRPLTDLELRKAVAAKG